MQEDVENKAIMLVINGGKKTIRMTKGLLQKAITEYLKLQRQGKVKSQAPTHGKQSVKKLVEQGQGVSSIEITDKNIKSFERVARKYGVDFALKKDITGEFPKYLVLFKSRDADAITAAFKEYTGKSIKRENRPSVLAMLSKLKEMLKSSPHKEKKKELER